jgi:hypothetical protein
MSFHLPTATSNLLKNNFLNVLSIIFLVLVFTASAFFLKFFCSSRATFAASWPPYSDYYTIFIFFFVTFTVPFFFQPLKKLLIMSM